MHRQSRITLLSAALLFFFSSLSTASLTSRELVVYQRNLTQVREVHTLQLAGGDETVTIGDILPGIEPGSVEIKLLSGRGIEPLSIAYAGRLFDFESYWNELVGSEVTVQVGDTTVSGILRRVTGINLFVEEAGVLTPVSRGLAEDELTISELPEGLVTEPSLLWSIKAKRGGEVKVQVSYLASGIDWNGQHSVLHDGKKAEVVGGATVSNTSGTSVAYDQLTFVGGEIHLAGDKRKVDRLNPKPGASGSDSESRFGQLRRWTVKNPGTLFSDAQTTFELTRAESKEATTRYIYDASIYDDRVHARLDLTIDQALPSGVVRIYEERGGESWLVGSDKIDGTPPGSPLELTMTQAFDLTAERTRTVERSAAGKDTWQNFQVLLGNSGAEDVTIRVIERTFGEWSVPSAEVDERPIEMIKLDARTMGFDVPVPAGKTVKLCYEIRYAR